MISDEDILVISALLHDIGKIENRKNLLRAHEDLGSKFLNDNLIMKDENEKKKIIDLVKYHHTNENELPIERKNDQNFQELLKILKEADGKTASHERDDKIKGDDIIKILKKIFLEIKLENLNLSATGNKYFPPYTLKKFLENLNSNSPEIFNFKGDGIKEYSEILNTLKDYFSKFDLIDLSINKSKINTLNSILMVTTRFVPSAFYYSEPNVPLYDHLKMTAAISQILYRQRQSENKEVLLIYGDIIGVQKYIFKYFKSSGADDKGTKRLRGRSLMVKLITDSVINYILDELSLYQFNVLFDSSDKFFILCDYSNENIEKLELIRKNVEKFLFNTYRDINISLVWEKEKLNIIISENLGEFIQKVIEKAGSRKLQLLNEENFDSKFFIVDSGINKICEKCGLRPAKDDGTCEICSLEEDIGEKIVKIEDIYRTNIPISGVNVKFKYGSEEYFYNFDFESGFYDKLKYLDIISINDFDYSENKIPKNLPSDAKVSWRFILQGNFIPKINNRVRTINDLACKDNENTFAFERACSYIGILKGDMDNMGDILRSGFGFAEKNIKMLSNNNYNFTKYSAFSFYTNIFFTLIINKIASEFDIYIAYSGGDDIVAIGEIDQILQFSEELNKRFNDWFVNSKLTISVGIAMLDTTYPLWKGINIAEEELHKSKIKDKNRITVFDETLKWGNNGIDEFENAIKLSYFIYEKIYNKILPKGFPYFLLELEKYSPNSPNFPEQTKKILIPDPYLEYYLKRRIKDYKEIRDKILNNFDHIKFSAIYSIIKLRKDQLKISEEVKK